jgi:hypothetical protein
MVAKWMGVHKIEPALMKLDGFIKINLRNELVWYRDEDTPSVQEQIQQQDENVERDVEILNDDIASNNDCLNKKDSTRVLATHNSGLAIGCQEMAILSIELERTGDETIDLIRNSDKTFPLGHKKKDMSMKGKFKKEVK